MRDAKDNITAEIPGVRPLPKPREKKYASKAEKQAAYRARRGLVVRTIHLPAEVNDGLNAVLAKKGQGISEVLANLIKSQLLRKR